MTPDTPRNSSEVGKLSPGYHALDPNESFSDLNHPIIRPQRNCPYPNQPIIRILEECDDSDKIG